MPEPTPETKAALRQAVARSTRAIPVGFDAPEARFAFVMADGQDPVVEAEALRATFADDAVLVRPLSRLDPDVLVARFQRRTFVADHPTVFAAAYEIAEAFGFASGEPDIHAAVFPMPAAPARPGPQPEALDFTAGCWVGEDPALKDKFDWALKAVHVPDAWAFSQSRNRPAMGEGIVVAQPDTGVTEHLELRNISTRTGYDFLDDRPGATDPLAHAGNPGHGTSTASVLLSGAATGKVTGTAPRATHLPIRAFTSVVRIGLVAQVTVAEAIDYAVAEGAHVISLSVGGHWASSLRRALRRAVNADVIVLAAAGNCVGIVAWPAAYDDCIAVAGVNHQGKPWKGSSKGPRVDISAPAENVFRAWANKDDPEADEVGQGEGTSYAVAITAGVAALWLAHHGRANLIAAARARGETMQEMFRRLLKATADRPSLGWDPRYGEGIIHARRLLETPVSPGPAPEAMIAAKPEPDAGAELQRFVGEAIGHPTAEAMQPIAEAAAAAFDWSRYGGELSLALLQKKLATEPGDGFLEAMAPSRQTNVSPALATALDRAGMAGILNR